MSVVGGPRSVIPLIQDGLVLYQDASKSLSYPGTGTDWFDLTSNSNDAVLNNGASYSSSDGGIISLDGLDDYVEWNRSTDYDFDSSTSFTIAGWFNMSSIVPPNAAYLGKWGSNATSNGSYMLWNGGSGNDKLRFSVAKNSSTAASTPTLTYTLGVWNYFTGVYTAGTKLACYLNGSTKTEVNYTDVFNNPTNVNLRISKADYPSASEFAGDTNIIGVYNRALSDNEVLENYNTTKKIFGL
jgi:hypothetical protein